MKKFDRLPPEQRRQEIQTAALALFREKGFAATTMENIVERVSLSKGGVYRFYPSTTAILGDLMLGGMRLRNAYYEQCVRRRQAEGEALTLPMLVEMIADSLLLYPEISEVYVEILWEKRRRPELETLYQQICAATVQETTALIHRCGADSLLLTASPDRLERLTELMNAAVLSMHVLGLAEPFAKQKQQLCGIITQLLKD